MKIHLLQTETPRYILSIGPVKKQQRIHHAHRNYVKFPCLVQVIWGKMPINPRDFLTHRLYGLHKECTAGCHPCCSLPHWHIKACPGSPAWGLDWGSAGPRPGRCSVEKSTWGRFSPRICFLYKSRLSQEEEADVSTDLKARCRLQEASNSHLHEVFLASPRALGAPGPSDTLFH